MPTHITQCDTPELLPFARSRIKALRATGLAHASQRFDVGGALVEVRVVGDQDFISISGGRGYLWVLMNYITGYVDGMKEESYTGSAGQTRIRSRLYKVSFGAGNSTQATLVYVGGSAISGAVGFHASTSTFATDTAPAITDFRAYKGSVIGLTFINYGTGLLTHGHTYFFHGIGKRDGSYGFNKVTDIPWSGIGGTPAGSLVAHDYYGVASAGAPAGINIDRVPSCIGDKLYFSTATPGGFSPQYTRQSIRFSGAGGYQQADDWAPLFTRISLGEPVLVKTDEEPRYTKMETAELPFTDAFFGVPGTDAKYSSMITYDWRGNPQEEFPGNVKPLTGTVYLARTASQYVWGWSLVDKTEDITHTQEVLDLREFPGIADDAEFMAALNHPYGAVPGSNWIDEDRICTTAMPGANTLFDNGTALRIYMRVGESGFPPVRVPPPEN